MPDPSTRAGYPDSSPTSVPSLRVLIVTLVRLFAVHCYAETDSRCLENPTAKFGEALRAQVEERLAFFDTGAPPSKNSDAIRKVLQDLALEDEDRDAEMDESGPALTTLEAEPSKKKKEKKRKARDEDGMDVDEEDAPTEKKVKLSKEERKALKKAKEAAKAEVCTFDHPPT